MHWGDLSYLLIDMPPGTGDIQMGLARMLPRTEVVVVTTPPVAAQKVAARTADMARKGYLRVAGVIENMSDFTCEHGETYALFGSGGGARLAADIGVPLIGRIPLHPSVAAGGDAGTPVALDEGSRCAAVFDDIAETVITTIAPVTAMDGCSARLLERVEAAVEAGRALSRRRRSEEAAFRRCRAADPRRSGRPRRDPGRAAAPGRVEVRPGLLVTGVARAQDHQVPVLEEDDREDRRRRRCTARAQAITSSVDVHPAIEVRLATVGGKQDGLERGVALERLVRTDPDGRDGLPVRRGGPSARAAPP